KNDTTLFGKPDISIKKYQVVIFIDSCFWHACSIHGNQPKTNREYWERKLNRNKNRDLEVNKYYQDKNWFILRIWEHEFKQDPEKVIFDIVTFIKKAKTAYNLKKQKNE